MPISTSVLSKEEIAIHDSLIELAMKLSKLPGKSRMKIYKRWLMLHMMTENELKQFDQWLNRVSDVSGTDRRFR